MEIRKYLSVQNITLVASLAACVMSYMAMTKAASAEDSAQEIMPAIYDTQVAVSSMSRDVGSLSGDIDEVRRAIIFSR